MLFVNVINKSILFLYRIVFRFPLIPLIYSMFILVHKFCTDNAIGFLNVITGEKTTLCKKTSL